MWAVREPQVHARQPKSGNARTALAVSSLFLFKHKKNKHVKYIEYTERGGKVYVYKIVSNIFGGRNIFGYWFCSMLTCCSGRRVCNQDS